MDLDQALHLERDGSGYVVHYAIADVAAFVEPGDPVDLAANERGETLYGADSKIPLHPTAISEDAASLLPDQVRPALLWTIHVDDTGEGTEVQVERARVRSTAKLDYATVAGVDRRRQRGGDPAAAQGARRAAARARGRPRRDLAAAARAGGRHRGRGVVAAVPLADPGRELERPDLAAHRLRRGLADGLRAGRPPAHAARRPTRATSSGCTARPAPSTSSGRPSSSTPTSSAPSTRASRPRRR